MMKIVSLNINSFGGDGKPFFEKLNELAREEYGGKKTKLCCDDALSRWDLEINCSSICESILELVNKMDADIIIFQEYYINSYVAEKFEEEMGCEQIFTGCMEKLKK